MSYEFIKLEISNGVGRLTLNRPDKRNALKRAFVDEILSGIGQLKAEPELRMLVLAAEGTVFCAGMDLDEMQSRAESADGQRQWQQDSEVYCQAVTELFQMSVPTVAVVSGPALAGGMGLLLACDMVIASDNAFFMLPEPMRGITAAMVTPLLVHRVGAGPAYYFLLAGERISAEQALRFNLCHDVVTASHLDARIKTLTQSIMTGSRDALAITKEHLNQCCADQVVDQIRQSADVSARARETADAREGLAAFLEKRKPAWQPAE